VLVFRWLRHTEVGLVTEFNEAALKIELVINEKKNTKTNRNAKKFVQDLITDRQTDRQTDL
jgi:hypothetical protein